MARENPTLQGADHSSRFLAWTGPQWLLIVGCALLGRLVLGGRGLWWVTPAALPALVCWLMGDYRLEPYAANWSGWLRRRLLLAVGRPAHLGITVHEDHIVTPDGLRLVIGVDTTSLDALTPVQQDELCAGLSHLARTRQPGQVLQLLVVNSALDGPAVMADIAATQAPDLPADLSAMARQDMAALGRQMQSRFVGTLHAYIVVGAPPRKIFSEQDALSGLRRAADTVRQHLGAMGLGSRVLGGDAVRQLLAGEPLSREAGATQQGEEDSRYLRLADGYAATIALLEPCEVTSPGYLRPLIAGLAVPYRLAIHVEGLDRTHESRRFTRRRNVEADDAAGQAWHGKRLLQSQRTGVVRWGVYLTLFAPAEPQLRWVVGQTLEMMEVDLPGRPARLLGHQLPAYWATLPTGYDTAKRGWRIDTLTVGNAFPFLDFNPGTRGGLPLGFAAGNQLVRLQPDDPDHRNSIVNVYGLTGSGKTVTGLILLKWALYGGARGTVIERTGDPERGIPSHYATFCAIAGGTMLYLGSETPPALNMWDGDVRHIVGAHEIILSQPGRPFAPLWRSLLSQGVRQVLATTVPLERDLQAWLLAESAPECGRPQGERDILREMAAILEPCVGDGEYAPLFDRPTAIDLDSRLLVFNTRGVAEHLHPVLMYLITGAIARRGRRAGEPPPITLLDEGWHIAQYEAGARALEEWGRRGRHTAMYLVFLTQAVRDLRGHPVASALFEAASITILMCLTDAGTDAADELATAFGLTETETAIVRRLQTTRDPQLLHGHAEAFLIRQSRSRASTIRHKVEIHTNPVDATVFLSDPLTAVWRRQRFIEEMGSAWEGCKAMAEMGTTEDVPALEEALP